MHRNALRRWFEMNGLENLLGEMGLTTFGASFENSNLCRASLTIRFEMFDM